VNRVLEINAQNCTGCRMCELACSSHKEGIFLPDKARIRVVSDAFEGWSGPVVCLQCENPMCMAVCPSGAIKKSETPFGDPVVQIDAEMCIACRRCVAACPFGAISCPKGSKAIKCDLCGGSPKCVEFCFYGCLSFRELSDKEYKTRSRKIKSLTARVCRNIEEKELTRRRVSFFGERLRTSSKESGPGW